jgi:hypothetical protein
MKTPMQELIETLKEMQESLDPYGLHEAIEMAECMLEKEKEVIINANRDGVDMVIDKKKFISGEQYYNETFNTEEKW